MKQPETPDEIAAYKAWQKSQEPTDAEVAKARARFEAALRAPRSQEIADLEQRIEDLKGKI